jgi:hypothetical protein
VARSIKDCRNFAGDAHTPGGILGELALTGLGYDYFWHFGLSFPGIGHGKAAFSYQLLAFSLMALLRTESPAPFVYARDQGSGFRVQKNYLPNPSPVGLHPATGCRYGALNPET